MRHGASLLALAAGLSVAAAPTADDAPDLAAFEKNVRPFFAAHCTSCHGPEKQKGKLRLDTLRGELARGVDGPVWKEIYDNLNLGEMPPKEAPRPAAGEVDKVVGWIAGELRKAERAARGTGGRVVLRRLNRAEYANTIRDLLHVRFLFEDGPQHILPPDGTSEGFDKVGKALLLDPSLLAQYLEVGRKVADVAIATGPRPVEPKKVRYEYEDTAKSGAIGYQCASPNFLCREKDVALMEGGARTWDHLHLVKGTPASVPVDGEYAIRLRMSADLGKRGTPLKVRLTWPGETVLAEWTLADAEPRTYEIRVPVKIAGKGRDGPQVNLVNGTKFYGFNQKYGQFEREAEKAGDAGDFARVKKLQALAKAEGAVVGGQPSMEAYDRDVLPKLFLDWIELEGPLGDWPPRSHRELMGNESRDPAGARRIFERLLQRAYRRPPSAADVEDVVRRVSRELDAGEPFEEAMKAGLQYALCSPKFLYLVEPNAGAASRKLDDYELASRLSYFLWSSLPDEELFRLAGEGKLRGALDIQVRRMLADPKAQAFVDGFAAQWLQAKKFAGVPPNRQIYKGWDAELEAAVKREPLAFFEEILRHDLSVLNFLDSDFAVLNPRLAAHYGIAGVEGEGFRRVALPPGSHRGGLATQAGILTIGSDGTRTLPVRRAVWVLETLFNSPPPPPPPNAGEVEPNIKGKNLTVRERLLEHQKIPACASCHSRLDPYGLAFENYDAVGAWRTRQNGEDFQRLGAKAPEVVASGVLPDGRTFRTVEEFRARLAADKDRFCRALAEKLLTYALGRSLEFTDGGTVAALAKDLQDEGYRMSALIAAVAKSEPFQSK